MFNAVFMLKKLKNQFYIDFSCHFLHPPPLTSVKRPDMDMSIQSLNFNHEGWRVDFHISHTYHLIIVRITIINL